MTRWLGYLFTSRAFKMIKICPIIYVINLPKYLDRYTILVTIKSIVKSGQRICQSGEISTNLVKLFTLKDVYNTDPPCDKCMLPAVTFDSRMTKRSTTASSCRTRTSVISSSWSTTKPITRRRALDRTEKLEPINGGFHWIAWIQRMNAFGMFQWKVQAPEFIAKI